MKQLPSNVAPYKKTPEFDELSIPKGLLNDHQTKENVWGVIVIIEGKLQYTINEPQAEVIILDPNNLGIVEPTVLHKIEPLGKVRFYVEFYK
jgi:tellurite resistance-related uncharacterized protein